MYISLHSFGQKIMYPWSYTKRPIPDWVELHSVGKHFAAAVKKVSRGRYSYQVGRILFICYIKILDLDSSIQI